MTAIETGRRRRGRRARASDFTCGYPTTSVTLPTVPEMDLMRYFPHTRYTNFTVKCAFVSVAPLGAIETGKDR